MAENMTMTFEALRDIIFEEILLLRSGKISIQRARVTSQLSRRAIELVTLDLYAQHKLGEISEAKLKRLTSPETTG